MTNINTEKLITACDMVAQKCVTIGGKRHGSAWLFDQLMRAFTSPAVDSVTYSVYLNAPLMCEGEAEINRHGDLILRRA